jgi:potassium efflux system protein
MINRIKNKYTRATCLRSSVLYVLLSLLFLTAGYEQASAQHVRDTVRFRRSKAEKKSLVMTDSALNEIGLDNILNKIEKVHITLTRINNTTATGFDTKDIEDNLPEIDSNIDIIDENLSLYTSVLDVKNLQMFQVFLKELKEQLEDYRTELFKYDKQLDDMGDEMDGFRKDTVFRAILVDSAFKSLYLAEITDLKTKWKGAKKSISDNTAQINKLQAAVSNEYFTVIDLQNKCRSLLKKISVESVGKEYDFLWATNHKNDSEYNAIHQLARKSYRGQRKILHYYFRRNWSDQFWMLFAGVIFCLWIFRNYRKVSMSEGSADKPLPVFTFIKKVSIAATLVVVFNIFPFFDLHPPTAYISIMEFFLVLTLTVLLYNKWPRNLYLNWLVMSALYIAFSITGALLTPDINFRMLLLGLNLVSIVFGLYWFRVLLKNTLTFSGMIKTVSVIYLVLNTAAVLCNMFGRLSLAKIFSVTAIFGLTQIIGLSVFIQIVTEAFELQTMVNKLKGGITAKLNFEKIENLVSRGIMIVAVCIWTIVFSISLNMYNLVFFKLKNLLNTPRTIGTTTFQIGNILLFLAIIYISNLLQQGIGSLYGKAEGNSWDPEVKKNGSRLAMTRLIFIVIGFLIAVAASGLPMDKITIVLGALGVGIGLGLQSIVNNLVSGVILIFEQPFRIGDYIELGDKKGRVLDIGIRSSKLVLEEGAELIMPNADLLSGRVINWTLRNDNVRIDFPLVIDAGHSFADVQKIILAELDGSEYVIKTIPTEILMTGMTEKTMSLSVLVWINDVHRMQYIKSLLLNNIYSRLAQEGIKVI